MNQAELITALERRRDEVGAYFAGLSPADFTNGTQEKWSPAHHLDHLVRSNTPVALGLSTYRERFTKPCEPRAARTYENIRDAYRAGLVQTGIRATGRFVPEPSGDQAAQLQAYEASMNSVRDALHGWNDAELDTSTMPHPVLNELTIREMLLFTLYHNTHHMDGVRTAQENP